MAVLPLSFPTITLEDGFAEEDPLWKPDERESHEHVAERAKLVLDQVFLTRGKGADDLGEWLAFVSDNSITDTCALAVVSITAHSGFITGLVAVTGHKPLKLPTGGKSYKVEFEAIGNNIT